MIFSLFFYIVLIGTVTGLLYWLIAGLIEVGIILPIIMLVHKLAEKRDNRMSSLSKNNIAIMACGIEIIFSIIWIYIISRILILATLHAHISANSFGFWILAIFAYFITYLLAAPIFPPIQLLNKDFVRISILLLFPLSIYTLIHLRFGIGFFPWLAYDYGFKGIGLLGWLILVGLIVYAVIQINSDDYQGPYR